MTDNVTELHSDTGPLDKAALLGASASTDFETEDYHVPGFGVIQVRALSRAEQQRVHGMLKQSLEVTDTEAWMVHKACVAPTFSVADVKKWQAGPLGRHIGGLVDLVNELSGIGGDDVGPDATEQFPE